MRRYRKRLDRTGEFWTPQHRPAELTDQQICLLVERLEARLGTTAVANRLRDLAERLERGKSLA